MADNIYPNIYLDSAGQPQSLYTNEEILNFPACLALKERARYEDALKLTMVSETREYQAIEITLREGIFLMTIIINEEVEPGDQVEGLLEDYYDGLLCEKRKDEERFPWEEIKRKLNASHGFT
jgi:hypothetical protein